MTDQAKPNILFIMTDQQHADCLGITGNSMIKTPNLDALAQEGAWFRNMYTCSAICAPSRTSYFTGTYLRTHNHFSNQGDLQRDLPSMASEAAAVGYRTGICGKSHLPDRIFQHFESRETMTCYNQFLKENDLVDHDYSKTFHQHFMSAPSKLPKEKHRIPWTAARAMDFIGEAENDDRPFFLCCSFAPPHAAHTPIEDLDDLYNPEDIPVDWDAYEAFEAAKIGKRAMIEDFWKVGAVRQNPEIFRKAVCRYLALITMIDEEVGNIRQFLSEKGLADNTIVIFTTDHGDFAGHWGQLGKNIPGYDDLIRIPFIYFDPARNDAGRCVEVMHQSVDLFPSLWERMGLAIPPTVQGISFQPSLDGYPGTGRKYIFSETHNVKTVRSSQWKLNFYATQPDKGQLFKMSPKADELTNFWDDSEYAHIKQEMMEALMTWIVHCEQADAMEWKMETFIDTRWYNWLKNQPHQCEDQEHPVNVS